LSREIVRLSAAMFGSPAPGPEELRILVEDLHGPRRLRAVGFPDGIKEPDIRMPENSASPQPDERLENYLRSDDIFHRRQETEWVNVSDEGPMLSWLQASLRREVGRRGIIVEINPSSNLLIGDFGDLRRHPFWRLALPPGVEGDAPPVSVCIG